MSELWQLRALGCGLGGLCALTLSVVFREALGAWLARSCAHQDELIVQLELSVLWRGLLPMQLAALLLAALLIPFGALLGAAGLVAAAIVPRYWLALRHGRHLARIDEQVPDWLAGLASVLRTTPSIGEALSYSAAQCPKPLRRELSRCAAETRLGASVAEALTAMSERVDSRMLRMGVAVLRIGSRMGGDVSRTLERAAASMRELARLESVVRVRTAEARAQAFVVAGVPVPTVLILATIDPGFLRPLVQSNMGFLCIAGSAVLWLGSIVSARRILDVDV